MQKRIHHFFVYCRLTVVFIVVALLMLYFESVKSVFLSASAPIWYSHTITIFASAALATAVTYTLRRIAHNAQQQTHLLLESVAEGIYGVDTTGHCTFVNPAFLHILGYQHADEVIGKHIHTLIHHSHADGTPYPAQTCRMYQSYRNNEKIYVDDEVFWRRDGTAVQVEYWSYPIVREGKILGSVATFLDITHRKQAEEALRLSEQRFRDVSEAAGEYLWEIDANMIYTYVSQRSTDVKGYSPEALLGHAPTEFMPEADIGAVVEIINRAITHKTRFTLQHRDITPTGQVYWEEVNGVPFYNKSGQLLGLRGAGLNITERKEKEAQIHQLAFYDALTQLPNRRLLNERLSQMMTLSRRTGHHGALLFLDLDNFKPLNDAHGHEIGDKLLLEVANRLNDSVREIDTIARFGGDEFVVVLSDLNTKRTEAEIEARIIAEKISARLSSPYQFSVNHDGEPSQSIEHRCTASIGVAMFNQQKMTQEEMMKRADSAMYQAKESGRNAIHFYPE